MADIIQLLPDSIANQIAAGEVIQRPASVVKELLENAIDAGSTEVKVIIKDAGKTLIQVIDNGCGMSETDARMSFQRHATSKIRKAKDLFAIRTMGFRGEALASIAAVAHVELKTRRSNEELGIKLIISGSEVKSSEYCQSPVGSSFSIKNLFFNVPARRNFLKSNPVEYRHIVDEFQRVAIANPDIFFSLHHNDQELYHLPQSNLRQRIVKLFKSTINKKLVPVEEETDVLRLHGYIGKPEYSKKTRGEQFIYVNNRFIKSGYLNHAIMGAYEDLIQKDTHPFYVIFIEIDPARIDINVHPTKQEIKFDDDRLVYNYLKVSIKHALGKHNITPTLDFEQEPGLPAFDPRFKKNVQIETPPRKEPGVWTKQADQDNRLQSRNLRNWEKLYDGLQEVPEEENEESLFETSVTIQSRFSQEEGGQDDPTQGFKNDQKEPYQIHLRYIVSQIKSGFLLVDQQAAHERILFERYLKILKDQEVLTQKELFSTTLTISPADAHMLRDILPHINQLGFEIQEFGKNTFVVHGRPSGLGSGDEVQRIIEEMLEQYKMNIDIYSNVKENIARSLSKSTAIKRGQRLEVSEMQVLIDRLFACEVPYKSPSGRNCFLTFELDDLEKRFN